MSLRGAFARSIPATALGAPAGLLLPLWAPSAPPPEDSGHRLHGYAGSWEHAGGGGVRDSWPGSRVFPALREGRAGPEDGSAGGEGMALRTA